jgi:hypothetical protein
MSIPWYNKRINELEFENNKQQEELIKRGQEIVGLNYLLERSREEYELITNKIAYIRDEIFDDTDFISDDGFDLTSNYAGSPYEVLCGMETKILRQREEIEDQAKWADAYFKELQTYKAMYEEKQKEVEQLKHDIEKIYEIYCDI